MRTGPVGSAASAYTGSRRGMATAVWEGVNLVNLDHHIGPTREAADVVLVKTEGHRFS